MPSTGKIFYSEEGNSTNSLICLHGIGGDDKSFEPQLKNLSSKYRVISWNMPGYKGSKTLENYTFENLCFSLNEFLSDLKIDNTTLMGQSIGGMLAQEFYFRYSHKVNSLILIATTSAFLAIPTGRTCKESENNVNNDKICLPGHSQDMPREREYRK